MPQADQQQLRLQQHLVQVKILRLHFLQIETQQSLEAQQLRILQVQLIIQVNHQQQHIQQHLLRQEVQPLRLVPIKIQLKAELRLQHTRLVHRLIHLL